MMLYALINFSPTRDFLESVLLFFSKFSESLLLTETMGDGMNEKG